MLLVGCLGMVYFFDGDESGDSATLTKEEIEEIEKGYQRALKNQLPIEEQIEELRRVEIKLYGKEISDFEAIRNNQ